MHRIAMDIGGTFTDVIDFDEGTRRFRASKVLSTPGDLSRGVFGALDAVSVASREIAYFVHGTTQGLNSLLERRGARILLLTSEGLGDVYQIARGNRNRLFDLHYRKPVPLVPRQDTVEIPGRLGADGAELAPLDEEAVRAAARRAREEGFDAVVVALLFAFLDARHEARAGEILRSELGEDVLVVLSHDVAPEWREYERTSTAVLEGYTGPSVHRYLDRIEKEFEAKGLEVAVHVMQSSGGLVRADFARAHPLQTLLSGPVGGTMGGVAASRLLGRPNVICADMGGTSFDVSLVIDHEADVAPDGEVEGFPLLMPLVNLHTVGAGGGSVAFAEGGALRVGPRSAGAVPGPAAYGNGGTEPTVTDANCVLGRVNPTTFADGGMSLDVEAADAAVRRLAENLSMDPVELAEGICEVSNVKMAQAIRTLTVDHGLEPNDFALLAFGGAGPMHAAFIAAEIGIDTVVVPRFPGAFSAWGMLEADIRRDFSRQYFATRSTFDPAELAGIMEELEAEAREAVGVQGAGDMDITVEHAVDMRYESQDSALTVPISSADLADGTDTLAVVEERFAELHERRYGHSTPGAPVQFITVRTTGKGAIERADATTPTASTEREDTTRPVVFDGRPHETAFVDRDALSPGDVVEGPAVVTEATATTIIRPGDVCTVDDSGFLVISIAAQSEQEAVR